ncbi:MAG TPA: TetR/AcrR family transcriptional regulator [Chloroflexota bacterium]
MPKTTDADKAARRRQIIDAAYRCFSRQGFQHTSMRDIYQEAHLSAGAVYHYFASKEAIVAASFQFDAERSRAQFAAITMRQAPVPALIELFGFFSAGLEDAAALGASRVNVQAWAEALQNPLLLATIRRAFAGYSEALTAIVAGAQGTAAINPRLDPRAVAHTLLSLYLGLELQKVWDPTLEVSTYREAVAALIGGTFSVPVGDGGQSGEETRIEQEETNDRVNNRNQA